MASRYLPPREAADLLGVGTRRLRELVHEGILVEGVHYFTPPGQHRRFLEDALEAHLRGERCRPAFRRREKIRL